MSSSCARICCHSDPEKCPVEEETDGAVDCMAVFPAAQVAPVRASQGCGTFQPLWFIESHEERGKRHN